MSDVDEASVGGCSVSRETFEALRSFEALVQKWSPAINLVSKNTLASIWDRHIVDSAQVFAVSPASARSWADLGTGGGFPGLVVAILARDKRPDLHVTLVEADMRKATFLRQVAQTLSLDVTVRSERIEAVAPLNADVVSARALAPLPLLLDLAAKHVCPGGVAIFPKGARHEEELSAAKASWAFDVEVQPSLSESGAAILVLRNIYRA